MDGGGATQAPPPWCQRPTEAFELELVPGFDPLWQWCGALPFGVVAVVEVVVVAVCDFAPPDAASATPPPAATVQTAASARMRVSLVIPPPFDALLMEAAGSKEGLRRA